MTRQEILGKSKKEIEDKIKRIEGALPQVQIIDGIPTPIWEEESSITGHMKKFNVPGISVAVINNFEIEWIKCYGIKDIRTKEEVVFETQFEGGSTAKSLTAAALLALMESKEIDLEEPVNRKLKGWKIPQNQFTEKEDITLTHLLTHTAGINRPDSMFGYESGTKPSLIQVLNGQKPAINDPAEVLFVPGSKHQYSNMGYIIIQKYLEDITGKTFPKLMREYLFTPLGMENSQFGLHSENERKNVIVPHDQEGKARESGIHPTAYAMGGLISTPRDLSFFVIDLMKAFTGNQTNYLSKNVAKKMLSAEVKLDPGALFGFTGQGLGMFLIESKTDLFFTHPGTNMPGATCMMIANPNKGQGAIIMANSITGELVNAQLLFSIIKEYKWNLWK